MLSEEWRKSSLSTPDGNCAEARLKKGLIEVRDSKQGGTGPVLRFTPAEWNALKGGFFRGEFDIPLT